MTKFCRFRSTVKSGSCRGLPVMPSRAGTLSRTQKSPAVGRCSVRPGVRLEGGGSFRP